MIFLRTRAACCRVTLLQHDAPWRWPSFRHSQLAVRRPQARRQRRLPTRSPKLTRACRCCRSRCATHAASVLPSDALAFILSWQDTRRYRTCGTLGHRWRQGPSNAKGSCLGIALSCRPLTLLQSPFRKPALVTTVPDGHVTHISTPSIRPSRHECHRRRWALGLSRRWRRRRWRLQRWRTAVTSAMRSWHWKSLLQLGPALPRPTGILC